MTDLQYAIAMNKAYEFLAYAIIITLFIGFILLFKFRNK